jgi:regulator of sigma E protease
VQINQTPINRWDDMTSIIHNSPGKEIALKIRRGDKTFTVSVTPQNKSVKDIFGKSQEVGLIGITPSGKTALKPESVSGALSLGLQRTWELSVLTIVFIVKLIQHIIPAETIGGPIMIFQMAGQQASQGAVNYFTFMAVISINLGVLNILPIPLLDGGHLLFLGIEFIRRKPMSEKVLVVAQRVGLALLVALMVFALYNDVLRLITGKMLP